MTNSKLPEAESSPPVSPSPGDAAPLDAGGDPVPAPLDADSGPGERSLPAPVATEPGGPRKSAYLEFGSTSIKFYLVESSADGEARTEREQKIPWDLGFDVFEHRRVSPRTIALCLSSLRRLQEEFPEISFRGVTCVGTAALREAQNAEIFQRVLQDELGLRIQIIEGGIEAFLLETGYRAMVDEFPTALFDLGGGSNELIEYLSPNSTRKTSIPVGAIRLHCHLRRTRDLFDYIQEGRRWVASQYEEHRVGGSECYPELIGTGGTVRAIAQCLGSDEFRLEDLQALIQREIHGDLAIELATHRRRLLLPGLIAVEGLFDAYGVQRILHRKASVQRGLISFTRMLPNLVES